MLERLTGETFAPHVGDRFELVAADGHPLELMLTSCEEDSSWMDETTRAPFSLIFHAADDRQVAQQICTLRHPETRRAGTVRRANRTQRAAFRYQVSLASSSRRRSFHRRAMVATAAAVRWPGSMRGRSAMPATAGRRESGSTQRQEILGRDQARAVRLARCRQEARRPPELRARAGPENDLGQRLWRRARMRRGPTTRRQRC